MKKAVIAGAGIGGLTAALCLLRAGWQVALLERSGHSGELDAGIQLSPNGIKVLRALGLMGDIERCSTRPERIEMRFGRSGRRIISLPLADTSVRRWGAPYLHIRRRDLISVLLRALAAQAPKALRTGVQITGYEQKKGSICALTASGARIEGDLLVGADGIHSAVRGQMEGAENEPPRFTGHIAWRMLVPVAELAPQVLPPAACIWVGAGRHAVTYPISDGLANFVGIVERDDDGLGVGSTEISQEASAGRQKSPAQAHDYNNSSYAHKYWHRSGQREQAANDFQGWHPIIERIIERAGIAHLWALHERPPLARWVSGRAVLLGDACHPMLPFIAQGAAMAIEDAWVLAKELSAQTEQEAALAAYQNVRQPRTTKMQAASRANARYFHYRSRTAQLAAYGTGWLAAQLAPNLLHKRQDWIYGHEVTR